MTTHQMKLMAKPFNQIVEGEKIIESRLYDEKRQQINVDDQIEFSNTDNSTEKINTKVEALYRYKSFNEMFSDFPSTYFGGSSKEELLTGIKKFYSEEGQKKYGVVGIKLSIINSSIN